MKLNIGQDYRIINNNTHNFNIGQIVTIVEKYNDSRYEAKNHLISQVITSDQVRPLGGDAGWKEYINGASK